MPRPSIRQMLFKEVHASSLGFLRVVFGFVMVYHFVDLNPVYSEMLPSADFLFKYPGFGWVPLGSAWFMELLCNLGAVASFVLMLGLAYRWSALTVALISSYIFLIEVGLYNNHYYLFLLLAWLFVFTDADRWGGLRYPRKNPKVPYWQVLIFQFQVGVVYFYGGIAKLNSDWLSGYPVRFWLHDRAQVVSEPFSSFLDTDAMALFLSWGGCIFDLLIPFLLLFRQTRYLALFPLVFFHVSNAWLWHIGAFPWIMMALTTIFFNPYWAGRQWKFLQSKGSVWSTLFGREARSTWLHHLNPLSKNRGVMFLGENKRRKHLVIWGLGLWCLWQVLFPLRQHLYDGHPSWTGEGHLFSWRMMLIGSVDAVRIKVRTPEEEKTYHVDLLEYVHSFQLRKISRAPKYYLQLAHFVRDEVAAKTGEQPVVNMEIWKSINERPPTLLNDTTLNYAEIEARPLRRDKWIRDWSPLEAEPIFDKDIRKKWEDFLEKRRPLSSSK